MKGIKKALKMAVDVEINTIFTSKESKQILDYILQQEKTSELLEQHAQITKLLDNSNCKLELKVHTKCKTTPFTLIPGGAWQNLIHVVRDAMNYIFEQLGEHEDNCECDECTLYDRVDFIYHMVVDRSDELCDGR